MALRVGEADNGPMPTLSDNVISAHRDVLEAKANLKEKPTYWRAVVVQMLTRHLTELKKLTLVR